MKAGTKHRTLLAGISHQIGQPLTVLRGSLEMALMGEPTTEGYRHAMEEALRQADRLVTLAGLLRELAAVESLGGTTAVTELGPALEEVLRDMTPSAETLGIDLSGACADGLWVRGERVHLRQALTNLVDCCTGFAPRGSRVEVSLQPEPDGACLSVRFSSSNLTAAALDRLLFPFDARKKGSELEDSTLGMAFFQRVIELLEGKLKFEEDGDRVSFIRIVLPRSVPPQES